MANNLLGTYRLHSTLQNKLKRTQDITHRIHSTLQNKLKQTQDISLRRFKGLKKTMDKIVLLYY